MFMKCVLFKRFFQIKILRSEELKPLTERNNQSINIEGARIENIYLG